MNNRIPLLFCVTTGLFLVTETAQAGVTYHRQIGSFRNAYYNDSTGNTTYDEHLFTTDDAGVGLYDVKSMGGQDLYYSQVTSGFSSTLDAQKTIVSSGMLYNARLYDSPDFLFPPDTTNRKFESRMSWETIFSWNGGTADCYASGVGFGPWTSAFLESGTYNAGVWTPGSMHANLLTNPDGHLVLSLTAGFYRLKGEYDATFMKDHSFNEGNAMTVYYADAPVPEPMTMAVLGMGALAILRRRKA